LHAESKNTEVFLQVRISGAEFEEVQDAGAHREVHHQAECQIPS
jgi:hypothetical protein